MAGDRLSGPIIMRTRFLPVSIAAVLLLGLGACAADPAVREGELRNRQIAAGSWRLSELRLICMGNPDAGLMGRALTGDEAAEQRRLVLELSSLAPDVWPKVPLSHPRVEEFRRICAGDPAAGTPARVLTAEERQELMLLLATAPASLPSVAGSGGSGSAGVIWSDGGYNEGRYGGETYRDAEYDRLIWELERDRARWDVYLWEQRRRELYWEHERRRREWERARWEQARRDREREADLDRRRAEDARRRVEEDRRRAEEERRRYERPPVMQPPPQRPDDEARRRRDAEDAARRLEEQRRRAQDDARRDDDRRRQADESRRRADDDDDRRRAAEDNARRMEEQRRQADEDTRRRADDERRREAEERAQRMEEQRRAVDEARRRDEEERRRQREQQQPPPRNQPGVETQIP